MDPARVREVWQAVSYWIASALDHGGGLTDFAMIEHAVLNGTNLLWLVWDGREILAAGITSLATANPRSEPGAGRRKFCTIVALGGRDPRSGSGAGPDRWSMLIDRIEQFAMDEGCDSVVIQGRRGWSRVLPGYREVAVVLERNISP